MYSYDIDSNSNLYSGEDIDLNLYSGEDIDSVGRALD